MEDVEMTYDMITEALNSIHPGSFVRIGYHTELPLKSVFVKEGYKIIRTSETTVRTGVNYRNIQYVKNERVNRSEPPRSHKTHIVPVIKNKIYKNENTEQMYLRVFPTIKGTNKVSNYLVICPDGSVKLLRSLDPDTKSMIRDSYFSGARFTPVHMIKLDNIFRIGSFGTLC